MCAIFGGDVELSEDSLDIIKNLFVESRIRGKHATGVAFLKNGIHCVSRPIPSDEFILHNNPLDWVHEGRIKFIAHCRYSTSDIRYNQPIGDTDKAIVHNGVVTQDPPELWSRYGYELTTNNDSELIWHSQEPLTEFPDASMAVAELYSSGELRWYRNGKRPLYMSSGFIFSTKDIGLRSGLPNGEMCLPGHVYTESGSTIITKSRELTFK